MTDTVHEFSVRRADRRNARLVTEASFEAAAVAYVEDYSLSAEDEGEIKVIVRDLANGAEHCFRIDLEAGETSPCD